MIPKRSPHNSTPRRGLLACLAEGLNRLAQALLNRERAAHRAAHPDQVANGYAPLRTLDRRTVPLTIAVPRAPAFVEPLRAHIDQYLAFWASPPDIAPHIRSTNPVEGLQNTPETIQCNATGSFHTEREAIVKTWILVERLQRSTCLRPNGRLLAHSLNGSPISKPNMKPNSYPQPLREILTTTRENLRIWLKNRICNQRVGGSSAAASTTPS